ncbi:TRAP transporter small permease subunit [Azospirillum halopraeferens]|uniref:TRAP transporter small permease subunit n=1 Tax=Azospirillum halopraeferens TaxID=34010 RepID=UPI0003FE4BF6|nr:TRAP transporter small permease subunit [Azospirillum halopraeferens]
MNTTAQDAHTDAAGDLPHTAFSAATDRAIRFTGEAASWLWPLLMLVIVVQVAMRYLLGRGSIMFEELQWHIYGVGFLIGLAYTLQTDGHVRVDVLAERWSRRTRAIIEIIGIVALLLPFAVAVIIEGSKLAHTAYLLNEVSPAPGGLPYRWVIKAAVPFGFMLLTLAALARLSRCTALVLGFPRPVPPR